MPLVHHIQFPGSASINDPRIFACLLGISGIGESQFSPENIDLVLFHARGHTLLSSATSRAGFRRMAAMYITASQAHKESMTRKKNSPLLKVSLSRALFAGGSG